MCFASVAAWKAFKVGFRGGEGCPLKVAGNFNVSDVLVGVFAPPPIFTWRTR